MRRRKLVIALAAAALSGVLVVPASAELHRVNVTLVTGEVRTMTVDVPPGQTVESIQIPGLPVPVRSVEDLGPVATATPVPELTATPTVPSTSVTPSPTPTPTPAQEQPSNQQQQQQQQPQQQGGGGSQQGPAPQPTAPNQGGGGKGGRIVGDDRASADPNTEAGTLEDITKGAKKQVDRSNPTRNVDGSPTLDNPTVSLATPGPARIGVPNFFIDKFRIPPFLLPIYQAAGIEYGVRWEVLAAINEIETDYGRNLNVSSAGALGWMQFMPATWELYGVDGNQDGLKDPYNPVDAIFAAARYLQAAGADKDLRAAIFAYNHADWYVDSVILRARYIGGLPADLVGSLSGLTQGRFPVQAKAAYAKDVKRKHIKAAKEGENPAYVVESESQRKGIKIFARSGAPVVAVNDGRIVKVGQNRKLGRFVVLQDVYGNIYTYAHLKNVVEKYPTPKPRSIDKDAVARELSLPARDAAPNGPASATTEAESKARKESKTRVKPRRRAANTPAPAKERLFANPDRPNASMAGGEQQVYERSEDFGSYLNRVFGLDRSGVDMKRLKRGARVTSGTVLGHVGRVAPRSASHLLFRIRPAGRGAPRIDPKPILDGWKLLESTAIYRAVGRNPFVGKDAETPSIGQILLMSKDALAQRALADPNIQMYDCGRQDVRAGQIDRRVLATLEFLVASGLKPTVTSLKCGHSYLTASGNVSEHTTGTAVDIAAINGVPIMGNQGAGSITELTIQRLLTLQGTMKPHQIISLMTFQDADNTIAMSDHADHIHVGFRPLYGLNKKTARQVDAILEPDQWIKLIERLEQIDNPAVPRKPSKYAVDADRRASPAHKGE
jgi:hypothetical protein